MSFITIEGGEGTGKSTLISGLAEALSAKGRDVVQTREPGGSPGAEDIRALLVTGEADRWDAMTELLLVNAARRDHVERVIVLLSHAVRPSCVIAMLIARAVIRVCAACRAN